jgi:hypothetical protein
VADECGLAVVLLSYASRTCEEWFKRREVENLEMQRSIACLDDRLIDHVSELEDSDYVYSLRKATRIEARGSGVMPDRITWSTIIPYRVQVLTAFSWISLALSPLPHDHKYKNTKT